MPFGKQNGTRAMVAVLALGREFGQDRLHTAVGSAVSHGACDVAAVRYLLTEAALHNAPARRGRRRQIGPLRLAAAKSRRIRHAARLLAMRGAAAFVA